ncbi:MAG: FtsQ-type POTRA domain-containing protein, partial [Lentisphaerae bacterium]|nr:FtsQ-type POTRA domain-containing protein [Lentisphaerota bacterium]
LIFESNGNTITKDHIEKFPLNSKPDAQTLKDCNNIFAFSIKDYRRRFLKTFLRVKSLEISRNLPGTLTFKVSERIPVAKLEMQRNSLELDAEAISLGGWRHTRLPVILGYPVENPAPGMSFKDTPVMDALEIINSCNKLEFSNKLKVRSIAVGTRDKIALQLESGEKIFLAWKNQGDGTIESQKNLEEKLRKLLDILLDEKKYSEIDLRLDKYAYAK